jgi:hypothetical protein
MLLFATTIPLSGVRGLIKNPFDVLKRVFKYDDYIHTINTSLESNNENDGDAIDLIT